MKITDIDLIPAPVKALLTDVALNSFLPGLSPDKLTYDKNFYAPSDIEFIKDIVKKKIQKSGKTKGNIEYIDYPSKTKGVESQGGSVTDIFTKPEARVQKTLGQFGYELVEGNIIIKDRFNFNNAQQSRQDLPVSEKIKTIRADLKQETKLSNYGKVRKVAEHLGSSEGSGATFKLKIPLENNKDK
tara:strand:+ start:3831 stop:4388 length:558 start_codon:yes stop_codon:yes gene_type:complete